MFISVIHLFVWPIAWLTLNQPREIVAMRRRVYVGKPPSQGESFTQASNLCDHVWLVVFFVLLVVNQ